MKRWAPITIVVLIAVGALVYSEYTKDTAEVSPRSFLNWLAQTQKLATRVPMRVTRLSDAEEGRIGAELAAQYSRMLRRNWDPSHDGAIEQYINEVGAVIVGGTTKTPAIIGLRTRRKLTYRFYYIPERHMINAFALPGGHIFVGEGLLRALKSEDQLAAVLGHEVAHVDLYHCAERAQVEAAARRIPLGGLLTLPVAIFQAGYGKEQELQADREGTMLSVHATYSAQGAVEVFQIFQRLHQRQQRSAKDPGDEASRLAMRTLAEYFRSHPAPEERILQIQRMMDTKQLPLRRERDLRIRF